MEKEQEAEDDFTNLNQSAPRMSRRLAATRIQAFFRAKKERSNFELIWGNGERDKLVIFKSRYLAKDNNKKRVLILHVYLSLNQRNSTVEILLFDPKRKRTEIKVDHQIESIGIKAAHRSEMI